MKYFMVFVCIALASFNFKSNCFPSRQSTDNPCENQPEATFLNHPLGCKYFIICSNGAVNTGSCPDGMAFNPLRPPCDLEANVDCSEPTTTQSTTAQQTTTESTTIQTTTQSTSTTLGTTTSTSTSTSTPSTTISTTTQQTTTPSTTTLSSTSTTTTTTTSRPATTTTTSRPDTTTTTSRPTTTSTTTTTERPTTSTTPTTTTLRPQLTTTKSPNSEIPPEIVCPEDEDLDEIVFLASNSHCSKYYICYHNKPIEMTCSPNLHWNTKTKKCDTIEDAKCTVSTMPSFFPVCPREAIGIYPHPLNCEWFLYCYHGHMTVQQCPFFYNWDSETQSCQLKTLAKCVLYFE